MAHAIRLLVATPNAPSDAQDKWDNWRTDPTCTATVGTTGVP